MSASISNFSEGMRVLVISACPADLHLCLGVIKKQPPNTGVLMLLTWANGVVQESLNNLFQQDERLAVKVYFRSGLETYSISQEKRWTSIYLFTMGADWLGRILVERKDVLRYRDCYLDYEQLEVRDISWNHLAIIKFHGLKYWLKTQVSRVLTFIRYHRYELEYRPDMHVWPQTNDIKGVWEYETLPDVTFNTPELPSNAVIFCFSSTDNGWSPNWSILRELSDNFFYKVHPRTGCVDYLEYPDWIKPLEGYNLPMELYDCPSSSLLIGTTSTALGSCQNSMSLWFIKLLDWQKNDIELSIGACLIKKSSMNHLNCRKDLYYLYNAYAQRALYMPHDNQELIRNIMSIKSSL
mgnify:CR=1 FL=1